MRFNPAYLKRVGVRMALNLMTLVIIITVSFAIMKSAPGKPFETERNPSPQVLEELHKKYDFTYLQYLEGILFHGDFRYSYSHRNSTVLEIIFEALPVSMELGFYALTLAIVAGLLWGLLSALYRGRWFESFIMALAMIGIAIPNFVLGSLLQLIFSLKLRVTPVAGWSDIGTKILPVITLSLTYIAYITRIGRGSFLENLNKDYIRTARAKGLPEPRILLKHLLRNSILPIINYLAPATASILTGTIVVEKIFNIPGMGRYFIESVFQRDFPLALGVIIVYSIFLLFLNLLADIVLTFVDPRIQLQ
ncbi:MAG: ABC-type transporter, integral rane subunit [Fibrobacteres bacterium]|nr:ABC-type transporter, integral rane subunit [Fibrobacterota bacterium]